MFRVFAQSSWYEQDNGLVGSYIVSDQPENYRAGKDRTYAATFPVSLRYDMATQHRRASEYCDYLNKGIVTQSPIGE